MVEHTFNVEQIKLIDIKDVRPNTWNPKDLNTDEYKNVVSSIKENGQQQLVLVRQNSGFEILDGEQRYRAMLELGYDKIYVYDMGVVDDVRAKAITLWFQVQVPFNRVSEAGLVVELANIKLPYTDEQRAEFSKVLEFDWDNFKDNLEEGGLSLKNGKEIECPECGHKFNI